MIFSTLKSKLLCRYPLNAIPRLEPWKMSWKTGFPRPNTQLYNYSSAKCTIPADFLSTYHGVADYSMIEIERYIYMYTCIKYGVIMNGHFGYCVRIMYMQIYIWENEHVNSVCILIFTTFEQPYSYAVISWWISCCTIWKVVEINSTMKYRWNVKLFRGNLNCSVEIQAALSFPMGKTQQLIPY